MNRTIVLTGILFGVLAITLGAFGAHGLENLLDSKALNTFETGIRYQMYHALFLVVLGNMKQPPEAKKKWIYGLATCGVILFSFSIYGLATNSLTAFDFKAIAMLTPIGGLMLIGAWILLGHKFWKETRNQNLN